MKHQANIIMILFCGLAINACGLAFMVYDIHSDTQTITTQMNNYTQMVDYQLGGIHTSNQRMNYRLVDLENQISNSSPSRYTNCSQSQTTNAE